MARRKGGGRGRGSVLIWSLLLMLVMMTALYVYLRGQRARRQDLDQPSAGEVVSEEAAADRTVVLVFPNWDGSGYVTEERRLTSRDQREDDLLAVMSALCTGPQTKGAVPSVPQGTRPLGAFFDATTGDVVLDFSLELVTNHPGGSASEMATLTSILRTVAINFPEINRCTVLVDGAQSETLAGHMSLDHPFQPRRWL